MAYQPKTQKTNIRCFKTLKEKAHCVSVSFTEGILTSWIFLWVLKKDSQQAMLANMRAERKNRPIWFGGNICDGDGVYCSICEEGIGSLQSCKTIASSVDWDQHYPSPEQHWQKHLQPAHHEQHHVAASTPWPTRSRGQHRAEVTWEQEKKRKMGHTQVEKCGEKQQNRGQRAGSTPPQACARWWPPSPWHEHSSSSWDSHIGQSRRPSCSLISQNRSRDPPLPSQTIWDSKLWCSAAGSWAAQNPPETLRMSGCLSPLPSPAPVSPPPYSSPKKSKPYEEWTKPTVIRNTWRPPFLLKISCPKSLQRMKCSLSRPRLRHNCRKETPRKSKSIDELVPRFPPAAKSFFHQAANPNQKVHHYYRIHRVLLDGWLVFIITSKREGKRKRKTEKDAKNPSNSTDPSQYSKLYVLPKERKTAKWL